MTDKQKNEIRGMGFSIDEWPRTEIGDPKLAEKDVLECPKCKRRWGYPVEKPLSTGGQLSLLNHAVGCGLT